MGDGLEPGFKSYNGGFWITFKNGVTISVQFGYGNYCLNRNTDELLKELKIGKMEIKECPNAEIAIWDKDGWLTSEFKGYDDDVQGWVTPEDLLKVIKWASKYKRRS